MTRLHAYMLHPSDALTLTRLTVDALDGLHVQAATGEQLLFSDGSLTEPITTADSWISATTLLMLAEAGEAGEISPDC